MDIHDIKKLSIRNYLNRIGIQPIKENKERGMYHSPLREDKNASFSVNYNTNLWYDHGIGKGGSIIDLVISMDGCSEGEAISKLEKDFFSFHRDNPSFPETFTTKKQAIRILELKPLTHPALMDYLNERCINLEIAKKYCLEVQYSINDKSYYAIGFKNNSGGYELRNKYFKGCTSKDISYLKSGNSSCLVFEGFIDYLSYLSLKNNPDPVSDSMVLNSVSNLHKAVPYLKSYPTIHAVLDNDLSGKKALEELRNLITQSDIVDQSFSYRNHKDLNDFLREKSVGKQQKVTPVKKKKGGLGI